jgi:hypothetical protein
MLTHKPMLQNSNVFSYNPKAVINMPPRPVRNEPIFSRRLLAYVGTKPMNVLISGAGIAGPTLAFWLGKYGFGPTLVESAPALRTSGYVIDFWGLGYEIAERMGLLPDIARIGYDTQELRIVDDCGRRLSGFGVQVFRQLTGGRYITLGRSDLSKLIYDRISRSCEIIFGDSITSLRQAHGRCMWNSSMAVNGASIWSSGRPVCYRSHDASNAARLLGWGMRLFKIVDFGDVFCRMGEVKLDALLAWLPPSSRP